MNYKKKCISTCIFNANKYFKTYLNIPKTIYILNDNFDLVIYHDNSLTNTMKFELSKYPFIKLIEK